MNNSTDISFVPATMESSNRSMTQRCMYMIWSHRFIPRMGQVSGRKKYLIQFGNGCQNELQLNPDSASLRKSWYYFKWTFPAAGLRGITSASLCYTAKKEFIIVYLTPLQSYKDFFWWKTFDFHLTAFSCTGKEAFSQLNTLIFIQQLIIVCYINKGLPLW